MDETHLIFLYHILVIRIIQGTAIGTLQGVVRVGPFKNIHRQTTRPVRPGGPLLVIDVHAKNNFSNPRSCYD